jgi:hypothetical protein
VRRSHWLLAVIFVVVAFGAWFGWMSYQTNRTQWISAKVAAAMSTETEAVIPALPRIEVHDNSTGQTFCAPNIYAQGHAFDVYAAVLMALNQDASLPPIKIVNVAMSNDYEASKTIVNSQALVQFPLVAGIYRTIAVYASTPVPHYQSSRP